MLACLEALRLWAEMRWAGRAQARPSGRMGGPEAALAARGLAAVLLQGCTSGEGSTEGSQALVSAC